MPKYSRPSYSRQTGSVLLIAIVFLMAVGAWFAASAINLISVSSMEGVIAHNANVALAAARSGLQYGVYMRKNTPWIQVLGAQTYPGVGDLALCSIAITEPVLTSTASDPLVSISYSSTISSSAQCFSNTSQQLTRDLLMSVTGTHDSLLSLDSYRVIAN